MSEQIPPIPPNCPYFVNFSCPMFETLRVHHGDPIRRYSLRELELDRGAVPNEWRPIIAAIARAAWNDLERDNKNEEYLKYCVTHDYEYHTWSSWREFIASVCGAWKLWGEQK